MPRAYEYDAFISHAVEDKIPIANELCDRLEKAGLKIWYSGRELNAGDSISTTIGDGLNQSRFGIVILSKTYISKTWTIREFYHFMAREKEGQKVILPVMYNVSLEDLAQKDLTMADRFAINADRGLDYVVNRLLEAINKENAISGNVKKNKPIWLGIGAIVLMLLALIYAAKFFLVNNPEAPQLESIAAVIETRIEKMEKSILANNINSFKNAGAKPASMESIDSLYTAFKNFKSYYRNEYEFNNGLKTIRAKKHVTAALQTSVENLSPVNAYGFTLPQLLLLRNGQKVKYSMFNTQPLDYVITESHQTSDSTHTITVKYNNNIRLIEVDLIFPHDASGMKKHQMLLMGFLPQEVYTLTRIGSEWKIIE
ncbi:MAG: toll/interleukin-1 receptor domain-containing protein [Cytophagia bacterium]|nr:toll/interleukin-1 receptor domain-containing protein [Cytophagia bacterium]